ncbi:MAG: hypothetical protein VB858_03740 [Planctomycetaceae bacterium]
MVDTPAARRYRFEAAFASTVKTGRQQQSHPQCQVSAAPELQKWGPPVFDPGPVREQNP